MFIRLKSVFFWTALLGLFLTAKPLFAAEPLKVVATQAMYADIVKQIGKDKVDVKFVASPKFNVHFIQPKPSDVRNVSHADLVVYTGLDLEEWWGPLLEAAGKPDFFPGREKSIDMSRGIRLLNVPDHPLSRAEGDIHLFGNPHITMSPENVKIMAQTVFEKLKEVDTKGVEITSQVTGLENVTRNDKESPCLSQDETLSNAKDKHNGLFKVKAVLES